MPFSVLVIKNKKAGATSRESIAGHLMLTPKG